METVVLQLWEILVVLFVLAISGVSLGWLTVKYKKLYKGFCLMALRYKALEEKYEENTPKRNDKGQYTSNKNKKNNAS